MSTSKDNAGRAMGEALEFASSYKLDDSGRAWVENFWDGDSGGETREDLLNQEDGRATCRQLCSRIRMVGGTVLDAVAEAVVEFTPDFDGPPVLSGVVLSTLEPIMSLSRTQYCV